MFVDAVSTVKAEKLRSILGKIHTLKPNLLEAELLSGVPIRDEASLRLAADALLSTGMHRVFISLGAKGVYAADQHQRLSLPCLPAAMVNATGAGDAFMAGLVWAYLEGTDLKNTAMAGLAAAAIAIESQKTINPAMSVTALRGKLQ